MNRTFPCGLIAWLLLVSPVLAREGESASPFSLRGYGGATMDMYSLVLDFQF